MMHFLHQPKSQPTGDEPGEQRLRQTVEPWTCFWKYNGVQRALAVPMEYQWDGMSIPRWAISLAGIYTGGMGDAASLPHDALYRAKGGRKPSKWCGCTLTTQGGLVSRKEADRVLYDMMIAAGFPKRKAWIAWAAVRVGGGKHWGGPSPYA